MRLSSAFTLACTLLLVSSVALTAPIYGTAAPLSGSRSVTNGDLTTSDTDDWGDVIITWSIVNNGNDTATYTYTLTGIDKPAISHLTIDITDDAVDNDGFLDPAAVTDFLVDGSPSSALETGDKSGITGAVKFDIGTEDDTIVYTFTSNRWPVYGDCYVKGGQEYLQNTGFGDRTSENADWYIARPNGAMPEPATMLVMALGGGMVLLRRKR